MSQIEAKASSLLEKLRRPITESMFAEDVDMIALIDERDMAAGIIQELLDDRKIWISPTLDMSEAPMSAFVMLEGFKKPGR